MEQEKKKQQGPLGRRLIVSPNPHRIAAMTTQKVMLNVLIALVPAAVTAGVVFGPRALLLIGVCALSCVAAEYICRRVMKKEQTVGDFSAVVTGVLLAMNLPTTLPLYMAVIGCFAAVVITKQMFGGLGQNFANPAIVGRIVLMISFAGAMTNWAEPFAWKQAESSFSADIVTSATPLAGGTASLGDLFWGNIGGCLGEVSAFALLLGGLYLIFQGIIHFSTPAAFIGTVFLMTWITGGDPLLQILSGGLFLGAFFMATDYVTTPVTTGGKIIFGVGCGLITFLIRQYGNYPEGVSFAILLMNLLTPYIERLTRTCPLGRKAKEKPRREAKREGIQNG